MQHDGLDEIAIFATRSRTQVLLLFVADAMLAAALFTLSLAPPPLVARQALLSSSLLSQSTSLFVAAANSADTCQSYAPGGGTDIDPVQGAALAAVATFILSFGYNTETNKKREEVEGPGVQRRALLVLVGLELGAALSRKKFEKEC